MSDHRSSTQNSAPWIIVGLLALLTGVFGFLFFQQKQELTRQEKDIVMKAKELAFTKNKLDSVSVALDQKIAEVAKLGGDITELQNVKAKLEKDLANFKRSDRVETGKYLAKIKDYEKYLTEKDTEIAELRAQNEHLLAVNDSLNTEVGNLSTERTNLVRRQQELMDTMNIFTSENQILTEQVNRAAALKAENLNVSAINGRGKEKNRESYKAKRVDKLKVAFNLAENPLTRQEKKEIYLRVLDPNGAILADEALDGGEFTTVEGQDAKFTAREIVAYTNNNQKVEMVYDYSNQFRPGRYSIELFSEGYKIGNSNFVIK